MRCLFIIYLLQSLNLFAQENKPSKGNVIGLNYLGGKIIVHTKKVYLSAPPYSQSIELSYKKQVRGNKDWHHRFGYPEPSLNVCLVQTGSSTLGQAIGFYPAIQWQFISGKKIIWFMKVGGGIGLASRSWQRTPEADTINNFIGSRINNFTMIQSGLTCSLSKYLSMQSGLFFHHLSNAAARSPNYGINTAGLYVGLNYHLHGQYTSHEKSRDTPKKNSFNLNLATSAAFAEDKTPDGPIYRINTFSISGSKLIKHKTRFSLGMDATLNQQFRARLKNKLLADEEKSLPWQYAVFAANEFLFGRVGLQLQLGYYLNQPLGGAPIYQKLGMQYHFYHNDAFVLKDTYLSLLLKSHYSQAQYAELGIGFLF